MALRDTGGMRGEPFGAGDVLDADDIAEYRKNPGLVEEGDWPVMLPYEEHYLVLPNRAFEIHPGESSGYEDHLSWSFRDTASGEFWANKYIAESNRLSEEREWELFASRIGASKKGIVAFATVGTVLGTGFGIGAAFLPALAGGAKFLAVLGLGGLEGGAVSAGWAAADGRSWGEIKAAGVDGVAHGVVYAAAGYGLGVVVAGLGDMARRVYSGWRASRRVAAYGRTGAPRLKGAVKEHLVRDPWADRLRYVTSRRFRQAVRRLRSHRQRQVDELARQTGWEGTVVYHSVERSSETTGLLLDSYQRTIYIRPHAFREPGGVKSVFLHELAHNRLPVDAAESMVDRVAVELAQRFFGHSDDIFLPFVD